MKVVLIRNPASGKARKRGQQFDRAMLEFSRAGWMVDVQETQHEGHATDLAKLAVRANANLLVAAGGDGTINEVIQGVAGTNVGFACLPMGTANVWCREIGLSSDLGKAARQLVGGDRVSVDLGRAGDRYFLLMAGVGLDAEVVSALGEAKRSKQRFGRLPYVMPALRVWPRYRGAEVELKINGHSAKHRALMVLASNTRWYGGLARPARHAIANDGLLDVSIYRGSGPVAVLDHLGPFIFGRRDGFASGKTIRTARLLITANPALAVQVDGDFIGSTPIEIAIERHALQALVPVTYDRSLLSPSYDH